MKFAKTLALALTFAFSTLAVAPAFACDKPDCACKGEGKACDKKDCGKDCPHKHKKDDKAEKKADDKK